MSEDWRIRGERMMEERYAEGIHFKQLGEHIIDCHEAAHTSGLDPEAFIVEDGAEWRDRIGRRGGSHRWVRFLCNDTRCRAVMLVRWDALARFVTRAVAPDSGAKANEEEQV